MHNRAVEAKNSSNLILVEHGTAPEGRQNKTAGSAGIESSVQVASRLKNRQQPDAAGLKLQYLSRDQLLFDNKS